jgi:hypothetical protein
MIDPPGFMAIPDVTLPGQDIEKIANRYKVNRETLEAIVYSTHAHYVTTDWMVTEGLSGPDTLDKINKPAMKLLDLLSDKVNQHRLISELLGIEDGYAKHDIRETEAEYELGLRFLKKISEAASHRTPAMPRKRSRQNLVAAYEYLARWYKALFPDRRFTSDWHTDPAQGLMPTSDAAIFVFDVMSVVDPARPRMAEELRELMVTLRPENSLKRATS